MFVVLALLALSRPCLAAPELDRLVIIVPASAGGGFDLAAQSVAKVLRAEHIVLDVEVRRSPGAGGLIGLAQFEGERSPKDPTILIGGMAILGAELSNHSLVSLTDLEPVCQLNEVPLTISVRADSPIHSVDDLLQLARSAPERLDWVGGSPGSADEMLLWAIAQKLGIARDRLKFIAVPGGGDQVLDRLSTDPQLVAIRSYDEFASYPRGQNLRLLAITGADRIPGRGYPTLREMGLDLVMTDWRGVFVSPSATEDQRRAIGVAFARLLASPAWAREVAAQKWQLPTEPQAAFRAKIAADRKRISGLLSVSAAAPPWNGGLRDLLARPWRYAVLGFVVAASTGLALVWQRRSARIKARELERALHSLHEIRAQLKAGDEASHGRDAGVQTAISRQMETWNLSVAELEIGWMILKGLQFKEIAAARGTSERTVRQQAQAIYAKSGLPNRSEFSAHFLEELRF